MSETYRKLGPYLDQREAAALAVLASAVRRRIETEYDSTNVKEVDDDEVSKFLEELEKMALGSIARNDANITYWIGVAAKQMNPLLG